MLVGIQYAIRRWRDLCVLAAVLTLTMNACQRADVPIPPLDEDEYAIREGRAFLSEGAQGSEAPPLPHE